MRPMPLGFASLVARASLATLPQREPCLHHITARSPYSPLFSPSLLRRSFFAANTVTHRSLTAHTRLLILQSTVEILTFV